jgi:hypothetical protein
MIPIKLAFDLLTTPPTPMSCHQYNFSSVKHADNNFLAPVVPRFESPAPSPSVYVHGPHQVWELGEKSFLSLTDPLP